MHVRFGVECKYNDTVDDPILKIFFFSTCARRKNDARRKKRDIRDQAKKKNGRSGIN